METDKNLRVCGAGSRKRFCPIFLSTLCPLTPIRNLSVAILDRSCGRKRPSCRRFRSMSRNNCTQTSRLVRGATDGLSEQEASLASNWTLAPYRINRIREEYESRKNCFIRTMDLLLRRDVEGVSRQCPSYGAAARICCV